MMQHIPAMTDAAAGRPGSGSDRRGRMMLVAAPPDRAPAVSFGSVLFQRIGVVFVPEPDGGPTSPAPANVVGELPQLPGRRACDASVVNALRHARRLHGEILCDASGRLYERIGHYVQPVHQLVAGPHGEVLDLPPPTRRSVRNDAPVIDVDDPPPAMLPRDIVEDRSEPAAAEPGPGCREIATPSARPRIVRFADFKQVLAPQLNHPERLRDSHRLSCRVQVYESTRTQRLDRLASAVFDGGTGVLLPLTAALASVLELTSLIPNRPVAVPSREPGTIGAGERVVRLSVIDDPSAVPAPSPGVPPAAAAAPAPSAVTRAGGRAVKNVIPERFIGPWPFTVSRDQAVCDLNLDRARSWPRRLFDWLGGAAVSGRERRKWQALLQGKTLDDQLWAVPPPRGGLCDRAVYGWARRTLAAASYDAEAMLLEWEIFWRRKGL
jgi:hypothetical protein